MRDTFSAHNRLYIREIKIDDRRQIDQVCDSLYGLLQDFVRLLKGIRQRRSAVHDLQQLVIGDHDQCIDIGFEVFNSAKRLGHTCLGFKAERFCHDADSQNALILRKLRHNRRRSGSCSAAHAAGYKNHVRALDRRGKLFRTLLSSFLANLGIRARAKTSRQFCADLNEFRRFAALQCLQVRVHADELNTCDSLFNHPVYRIVTGAADTYNNDLAGCFVLICLDF